MIAPHSYRRARATWFRSSPKGSFGRTCEPSARSNQTIGLSLLWEDKSSMPELSFCWAPASLSSDHWTLSKLHLHAGAGVEIAPGQVIRGRIEIVDVAGDAARRLGIEQIVRPKCKAEFPVRTGEKTKLKVGIEARLHHVAIAFPKLR